MNNCQGQCMHPWNGYANENISNYQIFSNYIEGGLAVGCGQAAPQSNCFNIRKIYNNIFNSTGLWFYGSNGVKFYII